MEMYDSSKCVLYKTDFTESDPSVQVHQKGLNTLIRISAERIMEALNRYLQEVDSSVLVHHDCQRRFVDTSKRSNEEVTQPKKLKSSLDICFNWKLHCFLCGKPATDKRKT